MSDMFDILFAQKMAEKKINDYVDDYCEEHFAQETGYVLDNTLTLENAAAQAKAVGEQVTELKADLTQLTTDLGGYFEKYESSSLTITIGYFVSGSGVITSSAGNYLIGTANVTAGDKYLITASTNWSNAYWAWYDSNNSLVSVGTISPSGSTVTSITDTEAIAPANAAKIVINYNTSGSACTLKHSLGEKLKGKWYGKKWVCIGDSLTEENGTTTEHYFDYVSEQTDITVVNMGVSGTGYKNGGGDNNPFYSRVLNVPVDADVVTIFGSFNDGATDLGTADDTGTSTIGGCINTTLDNLYSVIPTVQLGIVSPTPWEGANPYNHTWSNAYVELLESICEKRSIPFLNLYYESNLRPWNAEFRPLAYSKDGGNGVHPDETGHKIIAPRFKAFLETLLM